MKKALIFAITKPSGSMLSRNTVLQALQRKKKGPSQGFRKELEQYHFIEGPMASVSKKNPEPRECGSGGYQLCVMNEACAILRNSGKENIKNS